MVTKLMELYMGIREPFRTVFALEFNWTFKEFVEVQYKDSTVTIFYVSRYLKNLETLTKNKIAFWKQNTKNFTSN